MKRLFINSTLKLKHWSEDVTNNYPSHWTEQHTHDDELRLPNEYSPHDHIYVWLETGELGGVTTEEHSWEDG